MRKDGFAERKNMEKILTISIAAYNVQAYLENCLDSLLIPSMEKLEVLIENDGSKDDTAAIGRRYEEKYPGVFRLVDKENGGYGSTINNSIRLATGKYFKQLDGDDWYDTDNLERLVCQLESADADCVFTPFMEVYEEDGQQILRAETDLVPGVYPLEDVIGLDWFMHMHGLAFRTEILRENDVKILEHCFYTDQEYVIYPLLHCQSAFVGQGHIYCYRLGREGQSVSLDGWRKHCQEHDKVIRQLLKQYDRLQQCKPNAKQMLTQRLLGLIRWQYELYMMLGDKQAEMKAFDAYLRNSCPAFFRMRSAVEGKRIKLIRLSGFALYKLLRKKEVAG